MSSKRVSKTKVGKMFLESMDGLSTMHLSAKRYLFNMHHIHQVAQSQESRKRSLTKADEIAGSILNLRGHMNKLWRYALANSEEGPPTTTEASSKV